MRQFSTQFQTKRFVEGVIAGLLLMPSMPTQQSFAGDVKGISEVTQRDWYLNNQARRTLQKDDQLASENMGVTVKNKVATIWGTIGSPESAKRAEEALLKIPGIATVINECRIVPAADPVPQALADAVNRARELAGDPMLPGKLSPSTMASRQIVAKPVSDGVSLKPSDVPPPPPAVVLLAPKSTEAPADGINPCEKIRLSESRFKDLCVEVRAGVATIDGRVVRMRDAWDLAEKLNGLPSLKQVVIGKVVEK